MGSNIDILSKEVIVGGFYPNKVASLPYVGVNHRRSSSSYPLQRGRLEAYPPFNELLSYWVDRLLGWVEAPFRERGKNERDKV